MSNTDALFSQVAELLLGGSFICQHAFPDEHALLCKDNSKSDMERFLRQIGRALRQTSDESGFYAAYINAEGQDRKTVLRQQFAHTINNLEPLCRWLGLLMSATQLDSSLIPGGIIRTGELLAAIETTAALSEELDRMTRAGLFKTTRDSTSDRLTSVLQTLEKEGYLVSGGIKGRSWIATGKWSYLYDVLDFIHSHENIKGSDDEVTADTQQGFQL